MTDHQVQAASPEHDALAIETMQTVLAGSLQDLGRELSVLRELAGATKVRSRGFMSGQARMAADAVIRKERDEDAAVTAHNRSLPIPPNPLPKMGASPAPSNVSALELLTAVHSELIGTDIGARRRLRLHDKVLLATLARRRYTTEPTDRHFIAHLIDLTSRVHDLTWLEQTTHAIDGLRNGVRRYVYGEATKRLDAHCPWCGQKSLMMLRDKGVIVCGRSHDHGRYEPCICPFQHCDCKTTWHRHTWTGEPGFKKLIKQIRDADRQRAEDAEALAAAQRAAAHKLALAIVAGIDPDTLLED